MWKGCFSRIYVGSAHPTAVFRDRDMEISMSLKSANARTSARAAHHEIRHVLSIAVVLV